MFDLKFFYTRKKYYELIDISNSLNKDTWEKVKFFCQHIGNSEFCMESWRVKFFDWADQAEAKFIPREDAGIHACVRLDIPRVFGS